jgi:fructokinase
MRGEVLGGVEAGGTKIVCAVAREPGVVLKEDRFPTTGPEETLQRVKDYFDQAQKEYGQLGAIGYGTFGPAVVSEGEAKYGTILATPKPGWEGTDVIGFLKRSFPGVALAYDTDVNAAAMGEGFAGAARGLKNFIYITVGTGIGGGVMVDGKALRTRLHAEIGHMLVPRQESEVAGFSGVCPFHGDCLEGVASGTAMSQRWGIPAEELGPDHEGWELEADYLAAMVQNLVACYAPERIILGGGVMEHEGMVERVKEKFDQNAGDYWQGFENLLVRPGLGAQSGITGALVMAKSVRG